MHETGVGFLFYYSEQDILTQSHVYRVFHYVAAKNVGPSKDLILLFTSKRTDKKNLIT